MSATTILSSRFKISIPKAVREEQSWEVGQELALVPRGKGLLLIPVSEMDDGYQDRAAVTSPAKP